LSQTHAVADAKPDALSESLTDTQADSNTLSQPAPRIVRPSADAKAKSDTKSGTDPLAHAIADRGSDAYADSEPFPRTNRDAATGTGERRDPGGALHEVNANVHWPAIGRASALLLLSIALPAAVDVRQTPNGKIAILMPNTKPAGSIILIPGGSTEQTISETGRPGSGGNFVMRVRDRFVAAGFAVAYVENPLNLAAPIAMMRRIARPVVIVATSTGTIVAVDNALKLDKDGPDGVVLSSTVTTPNQYFSHGVTPFDVSQLHVPALFVHNTNDRCKASPLEAAQQAASGNKNVDFVEVTSDLVPGADQCEPFSPHGFVGIERSVVERILNWMSNHAAARAQ